MSGQPCATNEQVTDEEATDEEATDEDATNEEATDEEAMDKEATDEDCHILPLTGLNAFVYTCLNAQKLFIAFEQLSLYTVYIQKHLGHPTIHL